LLFNNAIILNIPAKKKKKKNFGFLKEKFGKRKGKSMKSRKKGKKGMGD
jgi:hypothetical protein